MFSPKYKIINNYFDVINTKHTSLLKKRKRNNSFADTNDMNNMNNIDSYYYLSNGLILQNISLTESFNIYQDYHFGRSIYNKNKEMNDSPLIFSLIK